MPFLRVIRDKRGYETTYLMHWYRDGNRQRSRILYVFRTPGGVRVGRQALEPEVQRHIESLNPDVVFDWNVVRDNQQIVEPVLEQRRRRPKREDGEAAGGDAAPAAAQPAAQPAPARPAIPSAIEGATPDEQIAFLAKWYPMIRDRVPQRTSDPARQEALLALAERLNPTTWTDADQITTGLQQASEALERLSHVFAKRRRRSKKRPGEAPSSPSAPAPSSDPETSSSES